MSWLRSAVNKAVEVGNNNNLTRTVKNYADSVVQQAGHAVAEGAKRFQDRLGNRSFRSVKKSVQRLEEAAVTCRGPERAEILRRWVVLLKEVERLKLSQVEVKESAAAEQGSGGGGASEDVSDIRKKISMVLYYDSDAGGEPMNFRDVFLMSQALEGITLSMIIEAPNDEEVALLSEMFRLCLTGGKEVHNAIVSSIQDLAKAFSSYNDEVLVKREELLQFAQGAITGLKINADLRRIDDEASKLKKKLGERTPLMTSPSTEGHDKASEETKLESVEALKKALAQIRACSRLEGLLQKKKLLNNGDTSEIHAQKVDKLKVLSESLASSSVKAENRISDNRIQKEEALKVRVTKASEVGEREKEIEAEVAELERQRDDLEAQLKKVNISLAAANSRLHNTREERDQFEEANTKIVAHLETKEDELSKSIASCKVEADVLQTWINFLEDTWVLQRSYAEIKEKQVNDELEKHEDYFVNFAIDLLSAYKKELGPSISRIGKFVENLKNLSKKSGVVSNAENEEAKVLNPLRSLEEEYLDHETKIITTFSVVDNMKAHFYSEQAKASRKEDPKVKELFDDIEKLRAQFETVERPILQIETPVPQAETPSGDKFQSAPSAEAADGSASQKAETTKHSESGAVKVEQVHDPEDDLAKLESEFGKVGQDYSTEEVGEWEFDELERELQSGDSSTTK
ncbi:protein GRIP [Argentina anserina]|uniref:protein GRIP n=1 Tax=Argentina anserina TaxID=57926 RepID=UPI0021766A52|nr:protein GRIP [Potentilla anserina]